jgi:hypothetical protein
MGNKFLHIEREETILSLEPVRLGLCQEEKRLYELFREQLSKSLYYFRKHSICIRRFLQMIPQLTKKI